MRGSMNKIFRALILLLLLNGCAETFALLGPVTSASGGKMTQSAVSSVISLGVKKQTGKSPTEHALGYIKDHNPQNKKEKCLGFLESTNSEFCSAVKKDYYESKEKIFKWFKVENLALKPIQKKE